MSLDAIVNLAERFLNNSAVQPVDAGSSAKESPHSTQVNSEANTGDQFTPSAADQQDSGLFQVKQISIFSAATDFFLLQTLQPQVNPAAASAAPVIAVATPAA